MLSRHIFSPLPTAISFNLQTYVTVSGSCLALNFNETRLPTNRTFLCSKTMGSNPFDRVNLEINELLTENILNVLQLNEYLLARTATKYYISKRNLVTSSYFPINVMYKTYKHILHT